MGHRYYQADAIAATWEFLRTHPGGHPLIAMPTATGKSHVLAGLAQEALQWPGTRLMMLTHVKELIVQNHAKLIEAWPEAPVGIYSAGLSKKHFNDPIVYGGVGSVYRKIEMFGHRDLLLIDEAHLLSDKADSMYGGVIAGLRRINPNIRIIGLTATPYRTGMGMLTDGDIFTDVAYDITTMDWFNRLIEEGYLCKLVPKRTTAQIETSELGISNGDYKQNELEAAANTEPLNYAVCKEMCEMAHDRKHWIVFSSGVKHAEALGAMLTLFGITNVVVHSDMEGGDDARDKAIADYKAGKFRALVCYGIATTGFDYPPIDFIGMVRATCSTGLWIQMLGRGMRPYIGKHNCLVGDFGGNTARLGPVNDPVIPRKRGSGKPDAPPIKLCPVCGVYHHTTVAICDNCGYEFPKFQSLQDVASNLELIKNEQPQVEWFNVDRVIYNKHASPGRIPTLKVTYICGVRSFAEYVCLEHEMPTRAIANKWWMKRIVGASFAPPTVNEALNWTGGLRHPIRIKVHVNKKYPEILEYEWL